MAKTADQIVNNWAAGMASPQASQKYKDGINGYNGNPMAMAATEDALNRYSNSCQQSVSSGRRAAALNAASPAAWKANAVNIGAARLATGAQKGKPKYTAAMQKWAGVYANVSQACQSMPKGGIANAQARASKAIEMLMQAAGKA